MLNKFETKKLEEMFHKFQDETNLNFMEFIALIDRAITTYTYLEGKNDKKI